MENLQVIEGINEAIKILITTRRELCGGSFTLWRLVEHAEKYLDKQIRELLAPPAEIDVCIAGAPAVNGTCGDPVCVCAPGSAHAH
jgi:hypothetical protein